MPMMVIASRMAVIKMAQRQPPAREHQPDDVADHAERAGADSPRWPVWASRDTAFWPNGSSV